MKKVLLVSKRLPELCASKDLLNGAGIDVRVVTSMAAAIAVGPKLNLDAIIICRGSFSEAEQQQLAERLSVDMKLIVGCPGCTTCQDLNGPKGVLTNIGVLAEIMGCA